MVEGPRKMSRIFLLFLLTGWSWLKICSCFKIICFLKTILSKVFFISWMHRFFNILNLSGFAVLYFKNVKTPDFVANNGMLSNLTGVMLCENLFRIRIEKS